MKKISFFIVVLLLNSSFLFSQVAVNTDGSQPDSSAMLDVKSIEKGFLLPRLTAYQQSTIDNPATGLIIFNADSLDLYIYTGSFWLSVLKSVNRDTIFPWTCGDTLIDQRDDQTYASVQIGTQCWMKENLNYATGNSWCYANDPANCAIYGRLYDWATIMNGASSSNGVPSGVQGICPPGWHVPSDAEWGIIVNYLGGESVAGGKMKEAGFAHWNSPNTGATNESGFTALPGGFREISGSLYWLGDIGAWWSSTEYSGSYAWGLYLNYDNDDAGRYYDLKTDGFSLRCLKD